MPNFDIEKNFFGTVIGLDEVGRGPLAGPVVSCGCHFKNYNELIEYKKYINDSKNFLRKKKFYHLSFCKN